jgi:CHASE3 domain sensor protein
MKARRREIPQTAEFLSLLFALLLVVFVAVFAHRAWAAFSLISDQRATTLLVFDGTNALLSSLKDAETGQRGFLLTGEDRYLEPYRQALTTIPATLKTLDRIEVDRHRPDQAQRIDRLMPLVKDKLDELGQTIEVRRSSGVDAALAIVRTDRGRAAMDQIRGICSEIQTVSSDLLTKETEIARASANQAGLVGTLGSAAVFVLLLLSTVTIQRGTRRRQQLIEALQKSEEQAKQARDWLQTTLGSIGDGVIATDASGNVTLLNTVAQSLTGWTQEEAAAKPLEEIFIIGMKKLVRPLRVPSPRSFARAASPVSPITPD